MKDSASHSLAVCDPTGTRERAQGDSGDGLAKGVGRPRIKLAQVGLRPRQPALPKAGPLRNKCGRLHFESAAAGNAASAPSKSPWR